MDNAGNQSTATATVTVEVAEPKAPEITVTSSNNYTINFTVANATVVKVNGAAVPGNNGSYVYNAEQGVEKTYTITAENAAGKTAAKDVPIKDETPPTIGEPSYNTTPTNQPVTVTMLVTDASGIASITVGGNQVTGNGNGSYSFTVAENGAYKIIATDAKGNKAFQSPDRTKIRRSKDRDFNSGCGRKLYV